MIPAIIHHLGLWIDGGDRDFSPGFLLVIFGAVDPRFDPRYAIAFVERDLTSNAALARHEVICSPLREISGVLK